MYQHQFIYITKTLGEKRNDPLSNLFIYLTLNGPFYENNHCATKIIGHQKYNQGHL